MYRLPLLDQREVEGQGVWISVADSATNLPGRVHNSTTSAVCHYGSTEINQTTLFKY